MSINNDAPTAGVPAAYPAAERLDLTEVLHGHHITDPYRWLEDAADPRTEEWCARQDELYEAAQQAWQSGEVREAFRSRLVRLLDTGYVSPPEWRGERRFFLRRQAGQEHNLLVTAGPDGVEHVLIDPVAIDPSGLTTLDAWHPSGDGSLLGYLVSEGGTEESALYVIDVDSGELVEGPIDRVKYTSIAWLPDGKAFYYVRRLAADSVPDGESEFHRRVYLHRLGTAAGQDVPVFGEGLEKTNYYALSLSLDGRWLAVESTPGTAPRTDVHLADLSATGPEQPVFVAVQVDLDAETHPGFGSDGRLYLRTTWQAPNGRLCAVDPERPGRENWREVLAEDPQAVLLGHALLDARVLPEETEPDRPVLLAVRSRNAISELTLHDAQGGSLLARIPTPSAGTIEQVFANMIDTYLFTRPGNSSDAWFGYSDDVTPERVYRFDARTRELSVWAESDTEIVLGSVHVQRTTYRSKDGTEVDLTIMSPTAEPDRPRPAILYGYGGFGVVVGPGFNPGRIPWVEAGGVFAIANLRGGGEKGEEWHRAGALGNKQNSFDDFHAAGDFLVEHDWTTREQLGVLGQSNGGLLVGAAITQRPEAYAAAVCSEPLLDMLRYDQFGLAGSWAVEYGSTAVPEEFEWLLGYSPYHHVRQDTPYPATLFATFEGDTRTDPLHARKLAAALQYATSAGLDRRPVLLRREHGVGHAGRSISSGIELALDHLAFLAYQLGLSGTP